MDLQTIDPRVLWIGLAVLAGLIIISLVAAAIRSHRTGQLRERFGSEYDRLASTRKRREVEHELLERERKVGELTIVPLNATDRTRLRREWERVQARFVDRPTTAVLEAEELIAEAMRLRGYRPADFEQRAADLSVNYPNLVADYREAHRLIETHRKGALSTEDMRRAMILQRKLFDELVGVGASDVVRDVPTAQELESEREIDRRTGNGRDEQRI